MEKYHSFALREISIKHSEALKELLSSSMADATTRAYASRWRAFVAWCKINELPHSPATPQTVALFIADLARDQKTCATIQQTTTAISLIHKLTGAADPTKEELVRRAIKGARRLIGVAPHKKQPIRVPALETIIYSIDRSISIGQRDTALLLLGFAGAFRRSELVALNVHDLSPTIAGNGRPALEVTVRRSKTDPEAKGMIKGIFTANNAMLCPIQALRSYMTNCDITEGPVFRRIRKSNMVTEERLSDRAVARIVQQRAARAGIELDVSGHSLRSGFITAAAEAGRSERSIQNQTGHRSITVLRGYIDRINVLQDNAAAELL